MRQWSLPFAGRVFFARSVPKALVRLATLVVLGVAVLVFPQRPAVAAHTEAGASEAATVQPGLSTSDLCSLEEWRSDPARCVGELGDVVGNRLACVQAPTPDAPDAGLGGWFAERPVAGRGSGVIGLYTDAGYAGYSYTTYDIGCAATLMHPDYKFENTIANVELMAAVAVVGSANALRERAWNPGVMWDWADPLVAQATRSIYSRVFTIFGTLTLAVVGVYLLWRSRQAQMSAAATTAGWALLVMVVVTAVAAWPVQSARLADRTLVTALDAVHEAVGPPPRNGPRDQCPFIDPEACIDHRPPALRASDTAVHTMLYRNWLRGLLGSADSETAQKYGYALYAAKTFSWSELDAVRDPSTRDTILERKRRDWMRIAEQIKAEDPDAYQYLQGVKGMERIGAGFIALLSATVFALFDITASLLVLLGFLVFRWAVIAAPLIGTVGLLRPASGGLRRLMHAVVAALFNVVVFGTGAAIYLHAVDLVMNTPAIPGWLQVVLVLLCGVVGWLLLRPYRRITQLGGKDPLAAIAAGGLVHRRRARLEESAAAVTRRVRDDPGRGPAADPPPARIELQSDLWAERGPAQPRPGGPMAEVAARAAWPEVGEPEFGWLGGGGGPERQSRFTLYRPGDALRSTVEPAVPAGRVEARREASSDR